MLGLAALVGLFAALPSTFSPQDPVFAQSNNPPSFASDEATRTVDENTPWLQNIGGPVTATDGDDDPLTYSLENAGTSHFTIVRSTGQLQTGSALNFEAQSVYTVKVIATDPSGAKDSITVTINVTDVDEPGTVSLSWKQPQVDTVLTATLTDPDGDISGVTWQWAKSSSKNGTYANIVTATSASYTPVAADERKFLRATASYTDANFSDKTAQAVSYRWVRLEPASNNAPTFPDYTGTTYHVKRFAPVGTKINNALYAEDADRDDLRYSLEGTDVEHFGIGESTGQLFTKTLFNGDGAESQYSLTVRATDPSGESATIAVTLTLSGGRWNPVVIGPGRISYPEGGTWRVAAYTASVPDGPTSGWIVSVQPGGGEGDFFDIDDDGVLTFKEPPDYKNPGDNDYSFSIMAYDGNPPSGQEPGRTFFNVNVTVIDVEEANEQPVFADPTATRSVVENTASGENVGDPVTATDPDRDPLHYTLGGTDASSFAIDSSTGQLLTHSDLDYETKLSYSVTVSVRDSKDADGNPDTVVDDNIDVTITVTDANETPEFPSTETGTRNVAENTASGENVGDPVTATDPDRDSLHYTLGGTDASSFDIDSSTGQLLTDAALDHETGSSYSVTVSVRDSKDADGNPDTATDDTIDVTITVTDANETPEFPSTETGTRNVAENTAAGENVGDPVTATDPDRDPLHYTLGGAGASSFDIDSSTGQLLTDDALDYETDSSYSVTVSVRDSKDSGGNPDTATDDTIDVTITVTDANEMPEFPSTETGTRNVAENTASGENVGDPVAATDPDGDSLHYTLGGTDASSFAIDLSTGQLLTDAALDHETGSSYSVTVSVRDSKDADGNPDTATDDTIAVTITVDNEDEDGTVTLAPPRPQVGTPQTAALTDPDGTVSGTTWVWESSSDGNTGWTVVRGATGTLTISSYTPATADLGRYLRATATYTDPEGPGKSVEAVSANPVQARPVTNSAPDFPAETTSRAVDEDAAEGENVGAPVTATDTDNGDTLTYGLEGDDAASFAIDSTSGQIKVATGTTLNYETKSSFEVVVSVRDSKDDFGVSDTATDDSITVTITVNDVDETPEVTGPDSIDYDENGDGAVASYTAFDPEMGNIEWLNSQTKCNARLRCCRIPARITCTKLP